MNRRESGLLIAAVAGIGLGLAARTPAVADEKAGDVKCWGINSCASHAKCSVTSDDLKAMQELLGEKDFTARFGKSETHGCAGMAKCGVSTKMLNWTTATAEQCKAKGGYIVEETGSPKKKVARKA